MSIAFKVFDPILNINDNCSWLPNPNHREIQSKNIEHPWESLWKYSPLVPADIKPYIRVFDWLIDCFDGTLITIIDYLNKKWSNTYRNSLLNSMNSSIIMCYPNWTTHSSSNYIKNRPNCQSHQHQMYKWHEEFPLIISHMEKKTLFRQWTIFRYTWARKSNTKFEPIMNRVIQIKSKEIKDLRESDGSISIVRVMLSIQNYLMEILLKLNWMIIAQFNESLSDDVLGLVISDYVTFFRWNQS